MEQTRGQSQQFLGGAQPPESVWEGIDSPAANLAQAVMMEYYVVRDILPLVPYLAQVPQTGLVLARRPALVVAEVTPVIETKPSFDEIIDVVAEGTAVSAEDIRSSKGKKHIAAARLIAMALLRESTDLSSVEIGRHLGGRHHSTILTGVAKVLQKAKDDPGFRAELDGLRQRLTATVQRPGESSVVLLTDSGLETVGHRLVEKDRSSPLDLALGDRVFIQSPDSPNSLNGELWDQYGPMAIDGLCAIARTRSHVVSDPII